MHNVIYNTLMSLFLGQPHMELCIYRVEVQFFYFFTTNRLKKKISN